MIAIEERPERRRALARIPAPVDQAARRESYNSFMRAEILSIGTELLIGSILNTNARFLSQKLAENAMDTAVPIAA